MEEKDECAYRCDGRGYYDARRSGKKYKEKLIDAISYFGEGTDDLLTEAVSLARAFPSVKAARAFIVCFVKQFVFGAGLFSERDDEFRRSFARLANEESQIGLYNAINSSVRAFDKVVRNCGKTNADV